MSKGAVRLPAAEGVAFVVEFVPLGVRPGAPDGCRALVLELLTARGADRLGLWTWLDADEKGWRPPVLLLSSVT